MTFRLKSQSCPLNPQKVVNFLQGGQRQPSLQHSQQHLSKVPSEPRYKGSGCGLLVRFVCLGVSLQQTETDKSPSFGEGARGCHPKPPKSGGRIMPPPKKNTHFDISQFLSGNFCMPMPCHAISPEKVPRRPLSWARGLTSGLKLAIRIGGDSSINSSYIMRKLSEPFCTFANLSSQIGTP